MLNELISFIQNNPYAKGLAILGLFIIASKVFLYISKNFVKKIVSKTETEIDDKLLDITETPVALVLLILGIKFALNFSGITFSFMDNFSNILNTLIVIAAGYAAAAVLDMVIKLWGRSFAQKTRIRIDDDILPLLHKTVKILVLIAAILFILKVWGVDIGPMLASLGIAGLAIGLALQSTLSNIFSGISLIFDKTFRVGDVVEVNNIVGIVHDIGLRSTRVKTFDNELISIPNGELATHNIKNYLRPSLKARIVIPFTVSYGTDHNKVKKLISSAVKKLEHVVDEPMVRFEGMGDSALQFKVYFWVDSFKNKWITQEKAVCLIYDMLNKSKISIPYPQMDVHLKR